MATKTITKYQLKQMIKEALVKEQFTSKLPHDLTDLSNLIEVCRLFTQLSPEAQQQLKLLVINGKMPQQWVGKEIVGFLDKVSLSGGISDAASSQANELEKALSFHM